MDRCSSCGNPFNGFTYGFGYNKICSRCNDQENNQRLLLQIQKERLALEKERLAFLKLKGETSNEIQKETSNY